MNAIPSSAMAGLAILIVVQLALQITALVQLVRTPGARVTIGGRKWVWALIIIFGEMLGPIIWFILGRKPAAVEVAAPSAATETRAAAADALYGAAAPVTPPPASDAPSVTPPPTPPNAAIFDDVAATPEALADDPAVGADGTGAGELP